MTSYGYDAAGNRSSVQDANGKTTTYTFDRNERPLTVTDPKSNTLVTLSYDAAGRVATRTNARGVTATYSYGGRNELAGVSYSDSTPGVSYGYDAAGNRTQMTDGTGTTSYAYDAANRLTSATSPGGKTVGYGYDADGNRTSVTYPGGANQASYGYDAGNRLTATTLPASTGVAAAYSYDSANHLTGLSWSQGSSTLFTTTYGLDNAGNRTSTATPGSAVPTPGTESYTLDPLNRLTTASYPGGVSAAYTYDKVGNRQTLVVAGGSTPGTTTYGYDSTDPNRLTSVTPPGSGPTSYSEDADGNTTTRGSDSLTWNAKNQLTSATLSSTSFSAAYNGDGLRTSRTVGGTTTTFVLSGGNVVDDGTQYVYGVGLVEHVTPAGTYWYLGDGSGSTVALVSSTGTVAQSYGYDASGNVTATSGSQPTEYQYDGQQTDPSGLRYLRARYYDPSTGRLLSRDPLSLGNPATYHLYTYAGNNPATNSDPSGQDFISHYLAYEGEASAVTWLPILQLFHVTDPSAADSALISHYAQLPGSIGATTTSTPDVFNAPGGYDAAANLWFNECGFLSALYSPVGGDFSGAFQAVDRSTGQYIAGTEQVVYAYAPNDPVYSRTTSVTLRYWTRSSNADPNTTYVVSGSPAVQISSGETGYVVHFPGNTQPWYPAQPAPVFQTNGYRFNPEPVYPVSVDPSLPPFIPLPEF